MTLTCHDLSLGYGAKAVISNLSLAFPAGRVTVLIGPNGCGKSTLLRGLAGLLKPQQGNVQMAGRNLVTWPRKQLARRLAFLPQTSTPPEGMTVREMVRHGRFPHQSIFKGEQASDRDAVNWALGVTRLSPLSDRMLVELSGGERQRVSIAMALAQQADILLLDEPTTYLDLRHQLEVLQLLMALNASHGITLVMSLHDLNQAMRYAHHAVVLDRGRLAASGVPSQVIEPGLVRQVFDVEASMIDRGEGHLPVCYPEEALCAQPWSQP